MCGALIRRYIYTIYMLHLRSPCQLMCIALYSILPSAWLSASWDFARMVELIAFTKWDWSGEYIPQSGWQLHACLLWSVGLGIIINRLGATATILYCCWTCFTLLILNSSFIIMITWKLCWLCQYSKGFVYPACYASKQPILHWRHIFFEHHLYCSKHNRLNLGQLLKSIIVEKEYINLPGPISCNIHELTECSLLPHKL